MENKPYEQINAINFPVKLFKERLLKKFGFDKNMITSESEPAIAVLE